MELTLKRLLEQAEFTRVKRGYDTDEVDDFLDRAVAMATKVEVRLTQAIAQAKSAEDAPRSGVEAGAAEVDIDAEVERRVQARLADAPATTSAPSGPSAEEVAEEARRTLLLAQRTADDVVREAREDAARLVAEAESRASEVKATSAAEAEAARTELSNQIEAERQTQKERLGAEIDQLEGVRNTLRTDLSALERHVEEQRSQLRSSVGELQRLLDDPAGFRMAPAPAPMEPAASSTPDPSPAGPANAAQSSPDSADDGVETPDPDPDPGPDSGPDPDPAAGASPGPGGGPDVPELTFADVDHDRPGDAGAPTAEVSAVDLGIDPPGEPVDGPDTGSETGPSNPPEAAAPPVEPVDELPVGQTDQEPSDDDDPFLSELRKAIGDEDPLGPREGLDSGFSQQRDELFGDERRPWRFGRRR